MLTGSFDHTAAVLDIRMAPGTGVTQTHMFAADVEALEWDPHNHHLFMACTEDGMVTMCDTRKAGSVAPGGASPQQGASALFRLQAHSKPTTCMSFSPAVPNVLCTGSVDKTVKIWDISEGRPNCVVTKNMDLGGVFAVKFCPDAAFLLGIGGAKGKTVVWDTMRSPEVFNKWSVAAAAAGVRLPKAPTGEDDGMAVGHDDLDEDLDEDEMEELLQEEEQKRAGFFTGDDAEEREARPEASKEKKDKKKKKKKKASKK